MRFDTIDTLFFDLDGTLTDNYTGIAGCIVHALARLDKAAPPTAELQACIGPPLRHNFARLLDTDDAAMIERALVLYRERFDVDGWRENIPYPGIHDRLRTLADRGFRMFVCTSKPHRYATRIVEHFELKPFFEEVYGPDLAGKLDDKRDLLKHAIAQHASSSAAIDPARALMIGDRAQDIRAGLANDMRALGVLYGYGSAGELTGAGASALCPSVDALVESIASLAGATDPPAGRKIDASS
jgi:phosphoglycolate phosphatase